MVRKLKYSLFEIIFFFEVIGIIVLYLFGKNGLPSLWKIKQENLEISREIGIVQQEVVALEYKCKQWQEYAFYKEKIAREQLQMAREGDYIFYYSNK